MSDACLICESPTASFGRQVILGRHDGEYRRCGACGFVFVANPHWLPEAYASAITALDTGIVARNLWLADATCALLGRALKSVRTAVDFGGGSGMLVRLMRDRGHNFHWHDAYSPNLLAIGFEADLSQRYDLATAFELVEHLPAPMEGFKTLHRLAPALLISTELLPDPAPPPSPGAWWYYAPEAGQHIGFFTERALRVVAERLGLKLSTNGRNLHVLAPDAVSPALLRMVRKPRGARWLAGAGRRHSLAHADAALLLQRLRAQAAR